MVMMDAMTARVTKAATLYSESEMQKHLQLSLKDFPEQTVNVLVETGEFVECILVEANEPRRLTYDGAMQTCYT